jgi:hypothetical protein
MADEEATAEPNPIETAVQARVTSDAIGPILEQQNSIADRMVSDINLEKLTHFRTWGEPRDYAKARFILEFIDAIGKAETNKGVRTYLINGMTIREETQGRFIWPDFTNLLKEDYRLRKSKGEATMNHLESITKIFERGIERARGLFGRR